MRQLVAVALIALGVALMAGGMFGVRVAAVASGLVLALAGMLVVDVDERSVR